MKKKAKDEKEPERSDALKPLSKVARAAREAGMSYGKYVALQHKEDKKR